jgi:protein disulfide-isomerase
MAMMKLFPGPAAALIMAISAANAPAGGDAAWLTDFEKAKQAATEQKRVILANFSASDWGIWCAAMDKEVLTQAVFKEFAGQKLVLFNADFPRKKEQPDELKKQNEALHSAYAIRNAFPTVLLLDASGKELARTGYRKGGAKAYVEHLKELLNTKGISLSTPTTKEGSGITNKSERELD